MSDDDEEQDDSEANMFDGSLDGSDSMGFGPLVPTESERTLMERVRQELKHELKQVDECIIFIHLIVSIITITYTSEGIQGENRRYQRRDSPKKKSWKTPL